MTGRATDAAAVVLERPFPDGRLALHVSSDASQFPFVDFAQALVDAHHADVVERISGPDEVFWDLRVSGQLLTLYRQHYLGTYLCATDLQSEDVLRQLQPFVARYLAEREQRGGAQWFRALWRHVKAAAGMVAGGRRTSG